MIIRNATIALALIAAPMPALAQPVSPQVMNDYMQDFMLVAAGVDFTSKDDSAIDAELAAYKAAVERLASGAYASVPAPMRQSQEMQARQHFQTKAANVDGEVEWASERVSRNGGTSDRIGIESYNAMLALDAEMDAGALMFPGDAAIAAAKAKTDAFMARFASREAADGVFEAAAIEEAKSVTMPPATNDDPSLVAMFRTAWGTSGIPYTVMKIHPRGGWGVKRDSLGRIIGRTHDAAIAARNPDKADHCNLYTFTLLKLEGGGVRRSSHATKRIACENVR